MIAAISCQILLQHITHVRNAKGFSGLDLFIAENSIALDCISVGDIRMDDALYNVDHRVHVITLHVFNDCPFDLLACCG